MDPTLLCIGHMDTVFDPGTAAERPFAIQGGIATGPGVTDMKSGLLAGLYAIAAVREVLGGVPLARLVFVANPDEEIGSPASTPHIRRLARDADACLVLECARANGDIVSSRKGTLDLVVTVTGRAAHAGVEPEKGRSAILEAARITLDLHALNGRWPGVTVNVGVIDGGTRPNVVAERCSLEVDVRAVTRDGPGGGRGGDRARCSPRALVPDVDGGVRARPGATGRWRSSSGPAGWSSTPSGLAGGARLRAARRRDGRGVGREHDGGHGRADDRWAGADRRAWTTRRRSTSRSRRSCPGRRCSRR